MKDFEKVLKIRRLLFEGDEPFGEDSTNVGFKIPIKKEVETSDEKQAVPEVVYMQYPKFNQEIKQIIENRDRAEEIMRASIDAGFKNLDKAIKQMPLVLQAKENEIMANLSKLMKVVSSMGGVVQSYLDDSAIRNQSFSAIRKFEKQLGSPQYFLAARGGDGVNFTVINPSDVFPDSKLPLQESLAVEKDVKEEKSRFVLLLFSEYKKFYSHLKELVKTVLENRSLSQSSPLYDGLVAFINSYLFDGVFSFDDDVTLETIQSFLLRFSRRDPKMKKTDINSDFNPLNWESFQKDNYFNANNIEVFDLNENGEIIKGTGQNIQAIAPELAEDLAKFLNIKLFFANAFYMLDYFTMGENAKTGVGFSEFGEGVVDLMVKQSQEITKLLVACVIYGSVPASGSFPCYHILPDTSNIVGSQEGERVKSNVVILIEKNFGDKVGIQSSVRTKQEKPDYSLLRLSKVLSMFNEISKPQLTLFSVSALREFYMFFKDANNKNTIDRLGAGSLYGIFDDFNFALKKLQHKDVYAWLKDNRMEEISWFGQNRQIYQFDDFDMFDKICCVFGFDGITKIISVIKDTLNVSNNKFKWTDEAEEMVLVGKFNFSEQRTIQLKKVGVLSPADFLKQLSPLAVNKARLYMERKNKAILKELMEKIIKRKKLEFFNN